MKTKLLLTILILYCFTIQAQLNIWTGTVDDKWSDENNWTGTVPTNSDDVLIPSGFAVTLDTPANILSIEVQGNSVLNITQPLTIANPSEFEDNVVVNWVSGDLIGPGILLNSGTINLSASIDISGSVVLNNPGAINLSNGARIIIGSNSVLNNSGTGIIDFQANGVEITKSGGAPNVLNNYGTIKTSFPSSTDEGFIGSQLINIDGVIQVESGALNFNNTTVNLMSGTYHVFTDASLNLNSPMTASGTLIGNVVGEINWNDDLIVGSTAFLDFSGTETITWNSGDLEGGGVLTNLSVIEKFSGATFIRDGSTLENEGEINLKGDGDIFISANGVINNTINGTIDFQANGSGILFSGGGTMTLNNNGLIQGSLSSGSGLINVIVNNSGTIEVVTNTLNFFGTLNNLSTGIIKGTGIIDVPASANFTNDGIFAPGASPGTLSVVGNYESTASSVLDLELNGTNQGVDYDLLSIQGNGIFDGDVQIALGFSPNINDEFIIATTSGSISTCTLPATKTADFGGSTFEFTIVCRNNDEVVLTVTDETLGAISIDENSKPFLLYPNPTEDIVAFSSELINKIEVYDVSGKLLIKSATNSISTKVLPSGIYLVKGITFNNVGIIKKLIKK